MSVHGINGNGRHADEAAALEARWAQEARWQGIERAYTAPDVIRLRGSLKITASRGRERSACGASSATSLSSAPSAP